MLTAYDYSTAKLIDEAGVNGILVGDTVFFTINKIPYGYDF